MLFKNNMLAANYVDKDVAVSLFRFFVSWRFNAMDLILLHSLLLFRTPVGPYHLCQAGILELLVDVQIGRVSYEWIYGTLLHICHPDLNSGFLD
jgi:hypothetical protein